MKLSVQERHKGKKNKMEKKRIILASGSPRRKELLLQIGRYAGRRGSLRI